MRIGSALPQLTVLLTVLSLSCSAFHRALLTNPSWFLAFMVIKMRRERMQNKQNYVSNELTHFVGGGLTGETPEVTREKQYALLLKILREGRLINPQGSGGIVIDPLAKLTSNETVRPNPICFCDIPLKSLAIHMQKYSPFGLAFAKSFLVERGANPVFYITTNSKVVLRTFGKDRVTTRVESRGNYLDERFFEFYDCMREAKRFVYARAGESPESHALLSRLEQAEGFLSSLFGYFKCFDASKCDDDIDNFYMEREWRITNWLNFKAGDVQRIVLPTAFLCRFEKDFPTFTGEQTGFVKGVISISRCHRLNT